MGGLQRRVRDARAGYVQSMDVLRAAKECGVYTKSSIMLGLGEEDDEIIDTMLDLRDAGADAFGSHPSLTTWDSTVNYYADFAHAFGITYFWR